MNVKHHQPVVERRIVRRLALLMVALVGSVFATAGHTQQNRLEQFVTQTSSFVAVFEQTLYDADSSPLQVSTGTIQLKRPGRFAWVYETPNKQRIVSDGNKLWLYDEDLEQVTVSPLADKVDASPLVILMGTKPLEEEFTVKSLGISEGVDWFELIPKIESADFESLFVGLNEVGLFSMELRDNFGQATQIIFTDMQPGVAIEDSVFEFNVPDGVDVIGQ